jgi:hypothetical protein
MDHYMNSATLGGRPEALHELQLLPARIHRGASAPAPEEKLQQLGRSDKHRSSSTLTLQHDQAREPPRKASPAAESLPSSWLADASSHSLPALTVDSPASLINHLQHLYTSRSRPLFSSVTSILGGSSADLPRERFARGGSQALSSSCHPPRQLNSLHAHSHTG